MTATLTASEVWLDSLRPIVDGDGNLTDVTAVFNIRYVDETGTTVSIRNQSASSFAAMTSEQVAMVTGIYQSMIGALRTQFIG